MLTCPAALSTISATFPIWPNTILFLPSMQGICFKRPSWFIICCCTSTGHRLYQLRLAFISYVWHLARWAWLAQMETKPKQKNLIGAIRIGPDRSCSCRRCRAFASSRAFDSDSSNYVDLSSAIIDYISYVWHLAQQNWAGQILFLPSMQGICFKRDIP